MMAFTCRDADARSYLMLGHFQRRLISPLTWLFARPCQRWHAAAAHTIREKKEKKAVRHARRKCVVNHRTSTQKAASHMSSRYAHVCQPPPPSLQRGKSVRRGKRSKTDLSIVTYAAAKCRCHDDCRPLTPGIRAVMQQQRCVCSNACSVQSAALSAPCLRTARRRGDENPSTFFFDARLRADALAETR